jgi:hypothetical protein
MYRVVDANKGEYWLCFVSIERRSIGLSDIGYRMKYDMDVLGNPFEESVRRSLLPPHRNGYDR